MALDERDVSRLRDVVEFGTSLAGIVRGVTRDAFLADDRSFYAACYAIQVIGEACWKISDDLKQRHPEIPWAMIAGMRHRLVHDYGRTDESVVHHVATVHVPELLARVRSILGATS